jgi:hypothetical protein
MARFGAGVVATPEDIEEAAQANFFRVLLEVVPDVAVSIRELIVPAIFECLYPAGQMERPVLEDDRVRNPWKVPLNIYDAVSATPEYRADLIPLKDGLLRWGAKWHLTEPWVLELALRFAAKDCDHYWDALDTYIPGYPLEDLVSDEEREYEIRGRVFTGQEADVNEYIDWVMPQIEKLLRQKCEEVIALAISRGAVRSKRKHNRSGDDFHFELLARYHCSDMSLRELLKYSRGKIKDKSTVRDAISNTAQLIGLPMRAPARGGRPRKPEK